MTPSETETLKMFDETFPEIKGDPYQDSLRKQLKTFWLTQLLLARADERKQAYEEGKNAAVDYIKENSKGIYLEFKGKKLEQYTVLGDALESARKA